MDRYQQLHSFVLVATKGSFAAAARAEGVTPVVMARRLTALECRLGAQLMHRSTRGLVLTESGEEFLEQARALLREFDAIESSVGAVHGEVRGHLTISAPAGFGRLHVAPHALSFRARHPMLKVSLNFTDDVVDLVREGYDLGIRVGTIIDPRYVALPLYPNRRVVCGTPDYFARHGRPLTPDALRQHECLALNLSGGQHRNWMFQRDGVAFTVRVDGGLDCNDGEVLTMWVKQGLGLGWRSTWEIAPELASGALVTVLDEFALPHFDILAVYPQQRHLGAAVRPFVAHLRAAFNAPDYWLRTVR